MLSIDQKAYKDILANHEIKLSSDGFSSDNNSYEIFSVPSMAKNKSELFVDFISTDDETIVDVNFCYFPGKGNWQELLDKFRDEEYEHIKYFCLEDRISNRFEFIYNDKFVNTLYKFLSSTIDELIKSGLIRIYPSSDELLLFCEAVEYKFMGN